MVAFWISQPLALECDPISGKKDLVLKHMTDSSLGYRSIRKGNVIRHSRRNGRPLKSCKKDRSATEDQQNEFIFSG